MKRVLLTSLAIAAAAVGAFFLGRQGADAPKDTSAIPSTAASAQQRADLQTSDPVRRHAEFGNFLTQLTADEAAARAHEIWSAAGEPQEIAERKRLFCYAWGQVAGSAAIEFARKQPGVGKVAAISGALAGWASKDPLAAKQWIEARLEPNERLLHGWALVDGWARHDPKAATDYVLGLTNIPGTDRFIRSIALEMTRQSGPAASEWAEALPQGPLRETGIDEVAASWARTAPGFATNWAFALTDSPLATRAVDRAVTEWARVDGEAAGAYLEGQPASSVRDAAVSAYIAVLAAEDLHAVSAWAATIRDSNLREQSLRRIAGEWMARNVEATLAWLPQSGLSAEAQRQIGAAEQTR